MLEKINNYLDNKDLKITLFNNKLNILNYEKLISIEKEYISVKYKNQIIRIKGEELKLKKILEYELLIIGKIKILEVVDE